MGHDLASDYRRDGVVTVRGLFSPEEVQTVCDELEHYIASRIGALPPSDYVLESDGKAVRNLWRMEQHSDYFAALAQTPRIRTQVQELVGGEPVLMAVESFCKPARIGSGVPPHQDNAYFCLTPPDVLTVWIALDAVTQANGPVNYVAGSHLHGVLPHARSGVAGNSVGIRDPLPEHSPYVGLLEPGDALLHHANTIHYSLPNTTDKPRRALLIVFRGPHSETDPALKENYTKAQQSA